MEYDKIKNSFFDIEKKYDLFNQDICGVYFWKLIRIHVYQNIVKRLTNSGNGHPNNVNNSGMSILKSKLLVLSLRLYRSAFKNKKTCKIIVFRHRRRVLVDGKYVEVNTAYIENWLKLNPEQIEYVETGVAYDNRNIDDNSLFLLCSPMMLYTKRIEIKAILKKNTYVLLIHQLEEEIQKCFGIHIDIGKLLEGEITSYLCLYALSKKFLIKKKPNTIYLVCSYGKEGIIQAAKDLNIKTIELQHGVITKYHMGYSYPIENAPYFPDALYVYGEYWKHAAPYPVSQDKIIVKGSPYFETQLQKYKDIEKENHSILFISSGGTGRELSKLCLFFAKERPEYTLYYKFHPSEFKVWHELYPELFTSKLDNIRTVEDEINIYELFARCIYLVGVNSTAIFESFAFNVKVILYNLPGVSYMNDVIKWYRLPLADNEEQLIKIIDNYPDSAKANSETFYSRINNNN